MNESLERLHDSELRAKVQALRKRIEELLLEKTTNAFEEAA